MPLDKGYGVLKCKILPEAAKLGEKNQHLEVLVEGETGHKYRIAINIKSTLSPHEVLYYVGEDFNADEITELPKLKMGFTSISRENSNIALDYIRGNLVTPKQMIPLPATDRDDDPDNDLYHKVNSYIQKAKQADATLYSFGEPWGPEQKEDRYFHFKPGRGIHNIHMNQGNSGQFAGENGSFQDGGVLIHFEGENKWAAMFMAFQSQSWCTDERGRATKPVEECDYLSVEANEKVIGEDKL